MRSLDQIIKDSSVIIMVMVIIMVKIRVIIILANIYRALTMCQVLSILHCLRKMLCFSFILSHNTFFFKLIYLFIFGCVGSSFLCKGFL